MNTTKRCAQITRGSMCIVGRRAGGRILPLNADWSGDRYLPDSDGWAQPTAWKVCTCIAASADRLPPCGCYSRGYPGHTSRVPDLSTPIQSFQPSS